MSRPVPSWWLIAGLALAGCETSSAGADAGEAGDPGEAGVAIEAGAPDDAELSEPDAAIDASPDFGEATVMIGRAPDQVCAKFREAFQRELDPDPVTGGRLETCEAGALTERALEDIRSRVNWYRWLWGLAPVGQPVAELNQIAQECALMMAAQGDLSHTPGPDWACYAPGGAEAAGQSNLSLGAGTHVDAIDRFMFDFGNNDTLGHRRWIITPEQKGLGYGYFGQGGTGMCQVVIGETRDIRRGEPVPYPPPGAFPGELLGGGVGANRAAWSISWQGADFSAATLQIRIGDPFTGAPIEMVPGAGELRQLPDGYGWNTALFIPDGAPIIGTRWWVRLEGVRVDGAEQPALVYPVYWADCR